jgi:3-methyladenine DNA glycosylase AlkD
VTPRPPVRKAARKPAARTPKAGAPPRGARRPGSERVGEALAELRRRATRRTLEGMARYGLPSDHALGVSLSDIQAIARRLGRDHELALALWPTGVYEARLLCAFVGEPARLTPAQMDRWCRDFDNWGVVDTLCFKLFDQSPHAWGRVERWKTRKDEFGRRAAFVLLACLAAHDKSAPDAPFLAGLRSIEAAATDERNFVKKGVSWALRMIGRRNATLHAAAVALSRRLAASADPAAAWTGRGALKELTSPAVARRFSKTRR